MKKFWLALFLVAYATTTSAIVTPIRSDAGKIMGKAVTAPLEANDGEVLTFDNDTSTFGYSAVEPADATIIKESELSSATNSTSTSTAANSAAVKAAYDLANGKQSPATTLSGYGITDAATSAQGALADTAVQPATLGTSATLDVGTTTGTVAAGDDGRFIPQAKTSMLTVVCGNSIASQSKISTNYWLTNSEIHHLNNLAGAPMRFPRVTASTRTDSFGVYGYGGATLATINSDLDAQWFVPLADAKVIPDLVFGLALLENDLGQARTVAEMTTDLTTWISSVRAAWPSAIIILPTPRPSTSYNTPTIVSNYEEITTYILSLDNGVDFFVPQLDDYVDPENPGIPLAGYTDGVHPNGKGAVVNARTMVSTIDRISSSWKQPFLTASSNFGLTGSGAATGTNVTGTVPTLTTVTGSANGVFVAVAENPGFLHTVTANSTAGPAFLSMSDMNFGSATLNGATRISPFVTVEIVSGAANLCNLDMRPRIIDGSGNNYQYYQQTQTNDVCPVWENGDRLTLVSPPLIAASGSITSANIYFKVVPQLAGGEISVRVLSQGIYPADPEFASLSALSVTGTTTVGGDITYNATTSAATAHLKNNTAAVSATTQEGPIYQSTGHIWNNVSGDKTMSAGWRIAGHTKNANPTISKYSLLVGTDSAVATERFYVASNGEAWLSGGMMFSGAGISAVNDVVVRNTTASISGTPQSSNKIALEGRAWHSVSGDIANRAYLQLTNVTQNANPIIEKLGIYMQEGTVGGAFTERFSITTAGELTLTGNATVTGTTDLQGGATAGAPIRLKGYTVATLPTGTQGDTAFATDTATCTFLATLTGGGSTFCPVIYNGSAWVAY